LSWSLSLHDDATRRDATVVDVVSTRQTLPPSTCSWPCVHLSAWEPKSPDPSDTEIVRVKLGERFRMSRTSLVSGVRHRLNGALPNC
jgi:hypothetical protein